MRPTVLLLTASAAWLHGSSNLPAGLDRYRPVPENNVLTPEKVKLGRLLFRDRRLSADGSVACASCHDPRRAFADGRRTAVGIRGKEGQRNTPTLVNRAWGKFFFLDGRSATLEDQVLQPVFNPEEMAATESHVLSVLRRSYPSKFRAAFPGDAVSLVNAARALACYVRTIVAGNSPFDRQRLTPAARRGEELFFGKAGCSRCHAGSAFTDEEFHNTGIAFLNGRVADEGRYRVSKAESDRGAFKTPTLREISRTAPYMHNGSLRSLRDVIEYYDAGGKPNPWLDRRLRQLGLTMREKLDLMVFLQSLSGTVREGLSP